ncbi:MAG TPA: insulinase family protein [Thermoanaerobaculia bacterium]|nr:insulinase family protein [Thermoanaerobaculia bacterium]
MKPIRTVTSAVALAVLVLASDAAAQVTDYREINTPPLRQFSMPQPKRVQLANGMVIFLMEDHELPLIRGVANVRGGSRDETGAKTGQVNILGAAWRTGGTQSQTGDQLDDFLEARAARVETGSGSDSTTVSFDILKGDFEAVFPIFVDLLRNPAFRQDKIDLARTQINTAISRRNDEPGQILGREATKLGYGSDSPYARQAEYATVAAVTREDLLAFHKRHVHPNNIIFGVVGDFKTAQMEARLRRAFASWPRGTQAPPPPTDIEPAKAGIYFIPKSDVTQSNIAIVHRGIQRNNPDYHAVAVMNEILSGGFSGRLMNKLRSQRGLTYGVGGGLGAPWDHPGLFTVSMATKSGTTLEALDALRGELRLLHTDPFTAEELTLAKESILNAFIFTVDSRRKVLNQAVLLEFYGFPRDYFQKYPSMIERVTAGDVARVAKKYVTPDQVSVLVVGNEKDFEKPLASLGTVNTIDITIPELGAEKRSAAPAASNAEGVALVGRMTEFAGGKAKIDGMQSIRTVQSVSRTTPQGPMEMEVDSTVVFPDRYRAVMKMPMGEMTMVVTPDAAFAVLPGMGTRDLPASQRESMKSEARHELLTMLKYPENYTFAVTGGEKVGNVDARVLEVSFEGGSVRLLVDPATGRVLRKVTPARGPNAQGDQVTEYTDYRSYGGVMLPSAATMTVNGEAAGSMQLKNAEVNPAMDPAAWAKPAA